MRLFSGLEVVNTRYIGSIWAWLNSLALIAAAGVIAGYLMLGGSYLILKTQGALQNRAFQWARQASHVTVAISIVVYIGVSLRYPFVYQKWLAHPMELSIAPALAVLALVFYYYALGKRWELAPLLANIAFVVFGFIGISTGLYPHILPNVVASSLTIRATSASPYTLSFMLIAMAVILPIILSYSGYKIWVFRGKTPPEDYGD